MYGTSHLIENPPSSMIVTPIYIYTKQVNTYLIRISIALSPSSQRISIRLLSLAAIDHTYRMHYPRSRKYCISNLDLLGRGQIFNTFVWLRVPGWLFFSGAGSFHQCMGMTQSIRVLFTSFLLRQESSHGVPAIMIPEGVLQEAGGGSIQGVSP